MILAKLQGCSGGKKHDFRNNCKSMDKTHPTHQLKTLIWMIFWLICFVFISQLRRWASIAPTLSKSFLTDKETISAQWPLGRACKSYWSTTPCCKTLWLSDTSTQTSWTKTNSRLDVAELLSSILPSCSIEEMVYSLLTRHFEGLGIRTLCFVLGRQLLAWLVMEAKEWLQDAVWPEFAENHRTLLLHQAWV